MARLLITTFAGPDLRTVAPLAWRKAMVDAGLLVDRIDELDANDPDLSGSSIWLKWPEKLKHLKFEPKNRGHLLAFMNLKTQFAALVRQEGALVERWFTKLFAKPVHCWVIGGHHGSFADGQKFSAAIWNELSSDRAAYAGLTIPVDRSPVTWVGASDLPSTPAVELPMAPSPANLRETRLVLVFGCDGVPKEKRAGSDRWDAAMSRNWQLWLANGDRLPMIVGWHHKKSMPAEKSKLVGTDLFAKKLQTLSANLSGDRFLALFEDADRIKQVAQCWGAACYEAFHGIPLNAAEPPYRNLWTHCGVLAPDRTVWHANLKFDGKQLQPPFDLSKPDKLPLKLVGTVA